jgi:hypothetical protein
MRNSSVKASVIARLPSFSALSAFRTVAQPDISGYRQAEIMRIFAGVAVEAKE